jgi:hypothetical protein
MRRREFLGLVGGAAAAWPLAARAQQAAVPVIGFIGTELPEPYADRLRAFQQGLKETGFVEGKNIAVEYRWAQGQHDRLPELAAELGTPTGRRNRRNWWRTYATGGEPTPQSAEAAPERSLSCSPLPATPLERAWSRASTDRAVTPPVSPYLAVLSECS